MLYDLLYAGQASVDFTIRGFKISSIHVTGYKPKRQKTNNTELNIIGSDITHTMLFLTKKDVIDMLQGCDVDLKSVDGFVYASIEVKDDEKDE